LQSDDKKVNKNNRVPFVLVMLALAGSMLAPVNESVADVVDDVMAEFAQLEKSGSKVGQDWFSLAQKARLSDSLDIASQALDRAASNGVSPIQIGVEKTRQHVAGDDPAAAVQELQGVMDAGFTSVGFITQDAVINSLAGRTDYDALIAAMSVQAYPCQHMPGFRDFDFWIGEWDVAGANGIPAGRNSIQPAERGCVLIENWTNTAGGTGMSVNYLDKSTNEWVQVWNAEGGSQINVRGGLTNDGMAMEGTIHYISNGTTAPFRALWTALPDGRVRQYFEQSNDGGVTWVPWFEGFYTRRD
jgi:hypothetical protein